MKALIFDNGLKLDKNYPNPKLGDNEVLIKTSMVGICNTDYEITKGYMGFKGVLGHEFAGVVEAVGKNVSQALISKRVTGEINCACNNCSYCAQGLQRHCPNRETLGIYKKNGCFSEYFTLPEENIIEISDNIDDITVVFTEPLAAANEILEQIHIKPNSRVAILGDGKLGLCTALIFSAHNIDFTHIGKHEAKLEISKNLGAKIKFLDEITQKDYQSFDIVIEATGSKSGFQTSTQLVKPRGILVLKSTIAADSDLNLAPVVVNEITVVGSRCGLFKPVIRLLEQGKINVKPLVSAIYPVDEFEKAFLKNESKESIKVLVKF